MERPALLFPSSYFNKTRVDEAFQTEYDAAVITEKFDVILFDYDKWVNEEKLELKTEHSRPLRAVYRGWMLKPESYALFYKKLYENDLYLITSPKEYERFHIFPNIYPAFGDDTAKMLTFNNDNIDIEKIKSEFSRFMVKDYVKSVKGTDFPRYFDNTISQQEFDEQIKIFRKYRSDLYTGGICIKEYLDLKTYGNKTNEWRVFYVSGQTVSICRNSGQGLYTPTPMKKLVNRYSSLGSPFYTVDYAEISDGTWKVIEAGDGQVSGLSDHQDNEAFFRSLYTALSSKSENISDNDLE